GRAGHCRSGALRGWRCPTLLLVDLPGMECPRCEGALCRVLPTRTLAPAGEPELTLVPTPGRFHPLLIAMALLTPITVAAQVSRDSAPVITAVTLDRHNIFDTSEGSFFG